MKNETASAVHRLSTPELSPGKAWPPYMLGEGRVKAMLRETYARIANDVAADQALMKEMRDALDWCRANGNPHRPEITRLTKEKES